MPVGAGHVVSLAQPAPWPVRLRGLFGSATLGAVAAGLLVWPALADFLRPDRADVAHAAWCTPPPRRSERSAATLWFRDPTMR